jgi:hypothetical protein
MPKAKPLPPLELVQQLLDYDPISGLIKWKIRKGGMLKGTAAGWKTKSSSRSLTEYIKIEINGVNYWAHRLAYYLHNGIDPLEREIDHIDGNGLNNKYNNLRIATRAENMWNRKAKPSTSGLKGAQFIKRINKWQASISCNGKRKYLGLFSTAELAHMAYCKAAAELHGEFARGQ